MSRRGSLLNPNIPRFLPWQSLSLKGIIVVSTGSPQPLPVANPNTAPVDKSIDLDGDGRLNLSEVQYAAFVHHGLSGTVVQGMFNEVRGQRVSGELQRARIVLQVDHNKDGFLDSEEFNDIRALVLAKAENAALRYMQVYFLKKTNPYKWRKLQLFFT